MIETLGKAGMGILLLASVPESGDPGLWAQWGLAGLVVGFTLWHNYQREKRMGDALEKHERWIRTTLIEALDRNTIVITRVLEKMDGEDAEDADA